MEQESIKTTIYLQAIITTNAAPDFSFFKKIADLQNQANLESAPKEVSPLLTEVTMQPQTLPAETQTSAPVEKTTVPVMKPQTKPKFNSKRVGNPNKPITERQIILVNKIINEGKFSLPEILETYHATNLSNLTDADVQGILDESDNRKNNQRRNNSDSNYAQ